METGMTALVLALSIWAGTGLICLFWWLVEVVRERDKG